MRRTTFDALLTAVGIGLAAILLIAGGLLTWGYTFTNSQVHNQLAAQKIYFPPTGSAELTALPTADRAAISAYAGQQLVDGQQAQAYADHFIAVHLQAIGGGKTYSQLSAAALAQPTNTKLAAQVQTMFRGTTLRGLLLNAYAFGTMGTIAGIAAVAAFIAAAVMLVLSGLGLWHSRRVSPATEVMTGQHERIPDPTTTV